MNPLVNPVASSVLYLVVSPVLHQWPVLNYIQWRAICTTSIVAQPSTISIAPYYIHRPFLYFSGYTITRYYV